MNYPVARGDRRQWLAAAVTILILVGGMMAVWVMSRAPLEPVDSIAAAETPDGASSGGDDGAAGPVHISVLEIWWRFAVLLTAIYGIGMGIKWFKTRREEMGQEMESSNQAGPACNGTTSRPNAMPSSRAPAWWSCERCSRTRSSIRRGAVQ